MKNKFAKRSLKKVYACIVDGKTEKWYIEMLRKHHREINVKFEPEFGGKRIADDISRLEELLKDNLYDKVIWIVDIDVVNKESREFKGRGKSPKVLLQEAYKKHINNEKVIVILNAPCLEYWYLLHFCKTTRSFANYALLERALKKYPLLHDYQKTEKYYKKPRQDIYQKLQPCLSEALKNSQPFVRKMNKNGFDIEQAICQMALLFKELGICSDEFELKALK